MFENLVGPSYRFGVDCRTISSYMIDHIYQMHRAKKNNITGLPDSQPVRIPRCSSFSAFFISRTGILITQSQVTPHFFTCFASSIYLYIFPVSRQYSKISVTYIIITLPYRVQRSPCDIPSYDLLWLKNAPKLKNS